MATPCKLFRWRTLKPIQSCCIKHQSTFLQNGKSLKQVISLSSSPSSYFSTLPQENQHQSPTPFPNPQAESDPSLQHDDYFGVKELVKLRQLFECNVHLGHNNGLRHESMSPFIFGTRMGTDIIDIEQTVPRLQHALDVCAHIKYRGGMILLVSRHLQTLPWIERMARQVGEYSQCRPWKDGVFTNAAASKETLPVFPDLCVFFHCQDTVFEPHRGIKESSKMLVPSIGICDTNIDNSLLDYIVPGNDDTPKSIHLYIKLFREAILKGKQKRKEDGLELPSQQTDDLKENSLL